MRIDVVEAYTLIPIKNNLDDNNAIEKILGHSEAIKLLDDDLFSETVKSITEPITLKHLRDSVVKRRALWYNYCSVGDRKPS